MQHEYETGSSEIVSFIQNINICYELSSCGCLKVSSRMTGRCSEHKSTSPPHELLFCVWQDQILQLPYSHIAHKGTSPLHEVIFCVDQDDALKLLYDHTSCMGTSTHHELLFCVCQYLILKLPSGHIACQVTLSPHKLLFCIG